MHGNDNKSGTVVLRAALAMSRELGKDVVAVGIEREDDVAYLRALGCEYAQGFYFGEPMSEREAMALLNALARSSKREEKREKKKKRTDVLPLPGKSEMAEGDEELLELPDEEVRASLPVPTGVDGKAVLPKANGGIFRKLASFGRGSGSKSEKTAASSSGSWWSLSGGKKKPAKKSETSGQPPRKDGARPNVPANGSNGADPQAPGSRLSRLDRPVPQPPRPPVPPSGQAIPPSGDMEAIGNYGDAQMRERRRRGQSSGA
jgi:hypothetical protein